MQTLATLNILEGFPVGKAPGWEHNSVQTLHHVAEVGNNDELCISNETFCITNEESCIENDLKRSPSSSQQRIAQNGGPAIKVCSILH